MKKFILFFSIFFFYSSFLWRGLEIAAQNDSIGNQSEENWSLGFQIAPNYSYRIAKKINDYPIHTSHQPSYNVNEEYNKYGWHFSTNFSKRIAKSINLNLGILIDNQGYKTRDMYSYNTHIYTNGNISSLTKKYFYTYNYRYLGLNIGLTEKYKINNKIYFFVNNGINYYFLKRLIFISSYDVEPYKGDIEWANDFSLFIATGLTYQVQKEISFSIQPFFNCFLTPLGNSGANDSGRYDQYFYSTGIEFGLKYSIGKKDK